METCLHSLTNLCFQLKIYGYNEKQKDFLEIIVNKIVNFEVDAKLFQFFKEKVS